MEARDLHLRESWARAMEARIVQEELDKCHRAGVNHYENCKWLADKYLAMLKENRVRSILKIFLILMYVAGQGLQSHRHIEFMK